MSASERVVVNKLSSSLLDMKFMLKKKKQIEAKGAKRREARKLLRKKKKERLPAQWSFRPHKNLKKFATIWRN
ncbi:hypothetical protein CRE_06400 [Caenorhabditis remanei]|uniref:Uncharacterized protein n=1 Tax=Caenorhabditis remanei TaxID=31234 RepID=E3M1Z5_CAERE|nr:hypothetical protein CRE_06400 [Caenorhabditis remanei]